MNVVIELGKDGQGLTIKNTAHVDIVEVIIADDEMTLTAQVSIDDLRAALRKLATK
jgi:hypothetical protein